MVVRDVRDAGKWPQQSHHHNVSPPPAAPRTLHAPAKWDKTTTGYFYHIHPEFSQTIDIKYVEIETLNNKE